MIIIRRPPQTSEKVKEIEWYDRSGRSGQDDRSGVEAGLTGPDLQSSS